MKKSKRSAILREALARYRWDTECVEAFQRWAIQREALARYRWDTECIEASQAFRRRHALR